MHEDGRGLPDFVPIYHHTIGRQVLKGIDRTPKDKEATSTWHDIMIPPAPERTLDRRGELWRETMRYLDLRIYLAMEARNDDIGDNIGTVRGG